MLEAVLFDQDGVIIDTERNGHRVAFNTAFEKCGYPEVVWDEELYHQLLQVGGGKERIKYYFEKFYGGDRTVTDIDEFAKEIHKAKTEIFVGMITELPLRPGIHRFMSELRDAGIKIGICTTSNEKVAETVANVILKDIPFDVVIAGDMVKHKKPDPEIYNMALEIMRIKPENALVVEDSHIGVTAAKRAGCLVLATYNDYTKQEDLSEADFIVSCLGDPGGEKAVVDKTAFPITQDDVVLASLFI